MAEIEDNIIGKEQTDDNIMFGAGGNDTQQPDVQYDEENIKHLSDMEHVRTRPGMYIGRLGDGSMPEDGIYVLLKEVIDNSIDEFKMNAGKRIEVDIEDGLRVSVRDYGRGIPQGKLIEAVKDHNSDRAKRLCAYEKIVMDCLTSFVRGARCVCARAEP